MKTLKQILLSVSIAAAAAAALAVNVIILLNTDMAQKKARQAINGMIPGSITWDHLSISPLTGRVEIRKAVLAGTDRRAIARFDRLTARLWVPSALRGKLDIVDARLEKPECFLELDGDGRLNIVKALGIQPKQRKTDSAPGRLPGFLMVRRCVLVRGRFGFARPAGNFALDVREITCTAGLDFADETGTIDLAVGGGSFTVKGRRTDLKHLALESGVSRGMAERLRIKLQTTASDMAVRGAIKELFRNPSFDIGGEFSLSLSELRDILNVQRPLDGTVTGSLTGRGTVNNPSLSFSARYSGGSILGSATGPISADLTMKDRVVSISTLRAYAGAGYLELYGSLDMRNAFPDGFIRPNRDNDRTTYNLAATSRGFDIRGVPGIAGAARGLIDADCALSGTGFSPGAASVDLSVKGAIARFSLAENAVPTTLTLNARAVMRDGVIQVSALEALLGNARLRAAGSFTAAGKALQASFSLESPDIAPEAASLGLGGCGGKLTAGGTLSGTFRRPAIIAALAGGAVRFRDIAVGDMTVRGSLDETGTVAIDTFLLTNGESRISLTGGAGIFDEGFTPRRDPALNLNIETCTVNAGDFIPGYAGRISLTGRLSGSALNPAGSLAMTGEGIDLGFQKFQACNGSISFRDGKAWIDHLAFSISPGEAVRCSGWIGTDLAYDLSLDSDPVSLAGIRAVDTGGGLRGRIRLDLKGSGSLRNPSLDGSVSVTRLAVNDSPYDDMALKLAVRDRRITVRGKLNFDVEGSYNFASRRFTVAALFNKTDLAPYLSAAGRKSLGGTVTGTIRAEGSVLAPDRATLDVRLSQLELVSAGERLVTSSRFDARAAGGTLVIPGIRLALLDDGWVRISGGGAIDRALNISLDSAIPLHLANRFTNNLTSFSGTLAAKGGITGTRSHPYVNADARLDNIGFSIPSISNEVRELNGTLSFTPERITLHDIRGLMGQGRFRITGAAGIRGLKLRDIRMDAAARNISIEIPDTMQMTFDADAGITGTYPRIKVRGNFTLLDGIYFQDLVLRPLEDIGTIAGRRAKASQDSTGKTLMDAMAMDVAVISRRPFAVDNNIASLRITTDLRMVGTLANPLLSGSARVESGVVHYLGRDFDIVRGKLDFINPYRNDPLISINSNARIQKWLVSIAITGTPAALKYELSSSPVLDSNNILSLVMLGKTAGGSMSYTPTDLLGQMIAFNYGGQIKKTTGIDSIEVKAQDSQDRGAFKGQVVTIGKNLDRRFSVYYSIGKDSREIRTGSAVKYKLSDGVLLNLDYDSRGKVGIDMQYNKEFR
ncbi:MAG TPA: translocation/assembly module TamB domain-containing protein [Spirochaetota bacterium]|nr:translocation/assembly module TamB domain-containing protein [Spirochaetota bacterium]HPL16112.1 translocation/assembly module TamB domain-containing protein [Spirochaetota bacterium]HQF07184.1 translocation/assembly module TamB domain-containing protein [Spirochaetota bacterium]HQH96083.1 translocation/assembly module TamB domain-containing protein [Spirochaetota bacterium]HQJ69261.1 translocation/assembly module TamB domain-containing protein [Spirochaetota bacterium]